MDSIKSNRKRVHNKSSSFVAGLSGAGPKAYNQMISHIHPSKANEYSEGDIFKQEVSKKDALQSMGSNPSLAQIPVNLESHKSYNKMVKKSNF
jgi:hypothetical protein